MYRNYVIYNKGDGSCFGDGASFGDEASLVRFYKKSNKSFVEKIKSCTNPNAIFGYVTINGKKIYHTVSNPEEEMITVFVENKNDKYDAEDYRIPDRRHKLIIPNEGGIEFIPGVVLITEDSNGREGKHFCTYLEVLDQRPYEVLKTLNSISGFIFRDGSYPIPITVKGTDISLPNYNYILVEC
jgi:hypothetical protein